MLRILNLGYIQPWVSTQCFFILVGYVNCLVSLQPFNIVRRAKSASISPSGPSLSWAHFVTLTGVPHRQSTISLPKSRIKPLKKREAKSAPYLEWRAEGVNEKTSVEISKYPLFVMDKEALAHPFVLNKALPCGSS